MTQLGEAIARYHKILESEPYKDLAWIDALRERMQQKRLIAGGRPVCPVLRPHFISRRQYTNLSKAAESLFSAIDRIKQMALANPALMTRMELLPAEKMLAAVDPGYSSLAVTSLLDTHLHNGSLHFVGYNADAPSGVAYGEALSELFYECPPVKDFRKKYSLAKMGGIKYLLSAMLKAWKEFGGRQKPRIAILEFRQQFQTADSGELALLKEFFLREGYQTEVVVPDQLEYRNGVLSKGDFRIDLIYRRLQVEEFLVRFDLTHPLVRAYQDRAVCMVNSFRSELAQKKAIFDLLTDDTITAGFPLVERKAIREFIPWTRVVGNRKARVGAEVVDLPEYILQNRESLVLKPNNSTGEHHSYNGWDLDSTGWERALRTAMRTPYVVQAKVEQVTAPFPVAGYSGLEFREMSVDVHPHAYLGKVQGCSSWLQAASPAGGFTMISGIAPTFLLESK
jgi:uncharacterized circularly permuted ATP-grasp superfamily protein